MLGQKIGEFQGRVTSRKVLPSNGPIPKVETSAEFMGPVLGVPAMNIVTYWSEARPDGVLYGEGQGVTMSPEGDMTAWNGHGMGRFTDGGGVSFRGAIYYQSASGKWPALMAPAPSMSGTWTERVMPMVPCGSGYSEECLRW